MPKAVQGCGAVAGSGAPSSRATIWPRRDPGYRNRRVTTLEGPPATKVPAGTGAPLRRRCAAALVPFLVPPGGPRWLRQARGSPRVGRCWRVGYPVAPADSSVRSCASARGSCRKLTDNCQAAAGQLPGSRLLLPVAFWGLGHSCKENHFFACRPRPQFKAGSRPREPRPPPTPRGGLPGL